MTAAALGLVTAAAMGLVTAAALGWRWGGRRRGSWRRQRLDADGRSDRLLEAGLDETEMPATVRVRVDADVAFTGIGPNQSPCAPRRTARDRSGHRGSSCRRPFRPIPRFALGTLPLASGILLVADGHRLTGHSTPPG